MIPTSLERETVDDALGEIASGLVGSADSRLAHAKAVVEDAQRELQRAQVGLQNAFAYREAVGIVVHAFNVQDGSAAAADRQQTAESVGR